MFPHFNKTTKILSIFLAIIASWGLLIFAIYDAGRPTEGVTGAIIQSIKSNPEMKENFSSFANPPKFYESSTNASPIASASANLKD